MEYLAFQARFRQPSFGKCLLIALQKPDATHVAGFHRWRELGRFIKKREKGVLILAPLVRRKKSVDDAAADEELGARVVVGFRAVYLFDVSKTDGTELLEFSSIAGDPGERLAQLKEFVTSHCMELRYGE